MEEWVGQWWHRAVTRAADASHREAAVTLDEAARGIGFLFRAGGGAPGVRVAPAADARHGGPRRWIERLDRAGSVVGPEQPRRGRRFWIFALITLSVASAA